MNAAASMPPGRRRSRRVLRASKDVHAVDGTVAITARTIQRVRAAVTPSLLLPGLVIGRWWLVPLFAIGWPALPLAGGIGEGWRFAADAGALGALNVALGVAVHRLAATVLRRVRRPSGGLAGTDRGGGAR